MEHLLSVSDAGLIITFFSCGQATFMQCYSVAQNKHLISATVHAGNAHFIGVCCGLILQCTITWFGVV